MNSGKIKLESFSFQSFVLEYKSNENEKSKFTDFRAKSVLMTEYCP